MEEQLKQLYEIYLRLKKKPRETELEAVRSEQEIVIKIE